MKQVIFIDEPKEQDEKPVEFTHYFHNNVGFITSQRQPSDFSKIVYLGKCLQDGDIFACYSNNIIEIYKGHLNSGKY